MSVEVRWLLPQNYTDNYSQAVISRSVSEGGNYSLIHNMDITGVDPKSVLSFNDPDGTRSRFYIIEYLDPTASTKFPDYSLGYFQLLPREKRLATYIGGWIPDVMRKEINDFDINMAVRLSLNHFNIYPPETNFNIGSFPMNYEQYLIAGATINLAVLKYLKVSIRDFNYSDMGLAINIERGTKIAKAVEDMTAIYNLTIGQAKWNFIHQGLGVGTSPLPISIGASLNRNMMGILDLMQNVSR
jgi:hypothetical protein